MIQDKKLIPLGAKGAVDVYEYRATLFHYFFRPMAFYEKLPSRYVRETIDYLRGRYKVIYLGIEDRLVGYGIITRGGGRNRFCTHRDAVLCSLWIEEAERGKGLGKILVQCLTEIAVDMGVEKLYLYICHYNQASRKSAQGNGYIKVCHAQHKGLLRWVVPDDDGPYGIYCRDAKQEGTENKEQ